MHSQQTNKHGHTHHWPLDSIEDSDEPDGAKPWSFGYDTMQVRSSKLSPQLLRLAQQRLSGWPSRPFGPQGLLMGVLRPTLKNRSYIRSTSHNSEAWWSPMHSIIAMGSRVSQRLGDPFPSFFEMYSMATYFPLRVAKYLSIDSPCV